jgi:hypothetical protein
MKDPAPDFWRLITHYTGQNYKLSCAVATAAIVVNAIARTEGDLRANDANQEYYGHYCVGAERLLAALSAKTQLFGHGGLLIVRKISR